MRKLDYTEAQRLRDKGLTLVEIAKRTGINRDTISRNTVKRVKKKGKVPKEGNQDVLGKGVAKVNRNLRVYETLQDRDKGKRKVKIDERTWVYTDKPTDEEAIADFNRRYNNGL